MHTCIGMGQKPVVGQQQAPRLISPHQTTTRGRGRGRGGGGGAAQHSMKLNQSPQNFNQVWFLNDWGDPLRFGLTIYKYIVFEQEAIFLT